RLRHFVRCVRLAPAVADAFRCARHNSKKAKLALPPILGPDLVGRNLTACRTPSAGGVTMPFKPSAPLEAKRVNPSLRHAPESPLSQSAAGDLEAVYVKIAKRIIPFWRCCL